MSLTDFQNYPLWANLGMFAAAAAAVWFAGSRLARYAASISDRTGIGAAFLGLILLGGITSLPEIAVTVTASLAGSAALRSEEHTSELQSLMRISYAVF